MKKKLTLLKKKNRYKNQIKFKKSKKIQKIQNLLIF